MDERTRSAWGTSSVTWESLEDFARMKIQSWFQELLEQEVTELLGRKHHERRRAVDSERGYRNGYSKPRRLSMQGGTITIRRPRVRGLEERFESRLLPLFARRTKEVAELLPELYLHGLSQGDFELALRGLLGEGAPLSPSSIARLRGKWQAEYDEWKSRRLDDRELVYAWADGIYVKAGLEREKAALLVVIGAMSDGRKEVLAVEGGYRESTESWAAVLRDLRDRGLSAPKFFVADGNLGAWAALAQVFPETRGGRCWNHRILNVLDQLPKKLQAQARPFLCQIPYAPTKAEAERRRHAFARQYRRTHPKAVAILEKDWQAMIAFYNFPEAHWKHLRTTDEIDKRFSLGVVRMTAPSCVKRPVPAAAIERRSACMRARLARSRPVLDHAVA
jgi:transposase-like protein